MSGIETAIRNALGKSDRADADVRARIYQSARQAVEAGLRKQGVSDPQAVAQQRRLLERLIGQIESEEQARLEPAVPADLFDVAPEPRKAEAVAAPSIDAPVRAGPQTGDLGGFGAERLDERPGGTRQERPEPAVTEERREREAKNRPEALLKPAKERRRRRGAGFFASLMVYGLLLAALGGGGWWFLQSGLIDDVKAVMNGERPSTQPAVAAADGDEDAQFRGLRTLDPRNGFGDDWLDVLKPGDAGGVAADGAATVEAVSTGDGPAVRVSGGNAEIAVPEAVLQEMSGKPSTIAITLQSSGTTPAQVAVECDFASLGHCGRHRFTVGHDRADILVHVVFDRTMAPTTPGRLRLLADLENKGRGINVFAVRVLPGQ